MPKLMCPGLHPMSTCMTLDPTHMLSVSNGRCIKLAQPSRQTWSCIPVQTDPCSFRRSSPAASGGVVGCGGALLGVQCASGDNNGGACVAGSVPPLAPNTAESSPRLFSPPPPPLITSPSVSPCLQFRHVPVFLLSCLSVSFCLQPTKAAIQPWRWWAGGKMPRLHRSSAAGTARLSVAD